jgi:hypothetical protein
MARTSYLWCDDDEVCIGYWTRAIKRFALFDLLKSLYSDTKISAEKNINDGFLYSESVKR